MAEPGMQMAKPDLEMLLKDAPEGKWIALSLTLKKVVGVGDTVREALAAAKANGELKPLVGKKPSIGPFVL
jgi:Family of unknown function (DUF5678)